MVGETTTFLGVAGIAGLVDRVLEACVADSRSYMLKEKTAILPLAVKLLRDRDWAAIDVAIRHIDDHLFAKNGEKRYAALRRQIAREAQASKVITH
jgi:hypothetical protein